MEELERTPEIKFILALNEMVCVGAAEGYGRAKGKPAVLNLHTGPGMAAAMPSCSMRNTEKCPWSSWSDRMTPASS